MKILVTCKRVPDADQHIALLSDGSNIDAANMSFMVNPFDAIALEEALRIREQRPEVEIVAVSVGTTDSEKELRTCLAMGANRGILVECEHSIDPWNVTTALLKIIERESPAFVLMGKQAVDDDSNQTGQFLAARLGWPQATFVSRLEIDDEQASIRVARETDSGLETMRTSLPAIITVDLRLNEPRYASLPSIMKARKKTIETLTLDGLGIELEPRLRVHHLELATTKRSCVVVSSAQDLVRSLREAKVL